jgi:hypothetical protein
MNVRRLMALSATVLVALVTVAQAGPCTQQIEAMQVRVDAELHARAAAGPTATESTAAMMHRQPTPGSVAAAEEQLSDTKGTRSEQAVAAMKRARAADAAGDKGSCERALEAARRAISP